MTSEDDLTGASVRAARALLAWSRKELAKAAGVAVSTVADFERGHRTPVPNNAMALRRALEAAQVQFMPSGTIAGPEVPRVSLSRTRKGVPLRWLSAQDLHDWASRYDAAAALPTLIAKLIRAHHGAPIKLHFPSDESTRQSGWDGTTTTNDASEFVPAGAGGWELSCEAQVGPKASDDFEKRTAADPHALNRSTSTYVFVTPRRWGGKSKWLKARRAEGAWRDVRAYDADDLVEWLEQTPAVARWLAGQLGKRLDNELAAVRDLEDAWHEWALATKRPLSTDLVLCDRDDDASEVLKWLRREPSVLALQATTSEEVTAFLYSAVRELPADLAEMYIARCLVIDDAAAARRLAPVSGPLVFALTIPEPGLASTLVAKGHHVLLAYDDRPRADGDVRILARASPDEIARALVEMNLERPRAAALARDCAGNLSVLRRLMPSNPGRLPRWAEAPTRSLLAALLVGGWDAASEGDRSIFAMLAGTDTYDDVEAELERYRGHFDQPLQNVGTVWRVASPLDAWLNLARHLSDRDLDRFEQAAHAVFGAEDPRYALPAHERWMAPVLGVAPPQSGWLRKGIGHTLILLAVRGRAASVRDAGRRADAIVNQLLDGATSPRWWSLARDLQLLAEASPAAFLSAIEDSLDRDEPPIGVLFGADPGGLSGTEYLSNLLWALETLAWSPEWLERVSLVLARLDRIDPARSSRHRNRPGEALSSIFLLWHPQTYAPLDQRLRVLDVLRGRESDASWRLLRGILPTGHGLATPTARPRWRDVVPHPDRIERVTNRLVQRSATEITRRLVDDAGTSVARWHDLLERLGDLFPDADSAVRALDAIEPTLTEPTARLALWTDLRKTIHRHREFPGVEWALPQQTVDDLDAIYQRLTPPDELDQIAWLFALHVPLLHPPDGWEANERVADAARIDAARRLYRTRGLAGVLALAPRTAQPGYLGKALFDADLGDQEVDAIVAATVPNSDALVRGVAHGLIIAAASKRPRAWCEALIATARTSAWDDSAIATILHAFPHERWTWDLATALGPTIEDAYWRDTRAFVMGGDALDVSHAIQKLTAAGRAHDALRIASHGAKQGVPTSVLVAILEAAVKQSVAVDSMFGYYIAEVMKVLDGRDDVPVATMLGLEWSYLSVLEHSQRPPAVLPRVLAEDPRHFIDLLKVAFRAETDDRSEPVPPERALMAEQAYRVLESWAQIPGSRADGSIDQARLEAWIVEARRLAGDVGRADIADVKIGQLLSAAKMGRDGNWPAEEVRVMLERFPSESMRQGFVTGKCNRRGVTTRGLRDGGDLEREEAARYQAWASAIRKDHHRTARALDDLAARYAGDAVRHDETAERLDWES